MVTGKAQLVDECKATAECFELTLSFCGGLRFSSGMRSMPMASKLSLRSSHVSALRSFRSTPYF